MAKLTRKKPVQRERIEQKSVFTWAKWQPFNGGKLADYIHHSPNGGKRNEIAGRHFKEMGTMAGFPDLFLFVPKNGWHGLFIELKKKNAKQSDISDNQLAVLQRLESQGYCCKVCFGANEAIDTIKDYLKGGENG